MTDNRTMSNEKKHTDPKQKWADPDSLDLTPLESLDPDNIQDFDQLLTAMSKTAFGGRNLGEALDVLQAMVEDPECHVVGTFSGAMTVGKMGTIICKMLDQGWINSVVSTGALLAHGFIESIGLKHYKFEPEKMEDEKLCKLGINRVYDTLEPELNFLQAEDVINFVLEEIKNEDYIGSHYLCSAIGRHLSENYSGKGVLKSAYEQGANIYIPAFTDSELALDVASYLMSHDPSISKYKLDPTNMPFQFDPFLDLFEYTRTAMGVKRLGIFTVGGGVPRNWAQQLGPFVEMSLNRMPDLDWEIKRFQYGVRICPEPDYWGGLSGCTYKEGVSWGKFVAPSDGGRYAEVLCDATIAWPILIKGLQDRLKQ